MGTDLANGEVNRGARTLKCPLHGALFDFTTGRCLSGSYGADPDAFPSIRKYRVPRHRETTSFSKENRTGVGSGSVSSGQVEERRDTDYRDGDTHELVQLRLFLTKQDTP